MKVRLFKMVRNTNLFKNNQKVWLRTTTGSGRHRVVGKYRGKGRYVEGWVSDNQYRDVGEIEVTEKFGKLLGLNNPVGITGDSSSRAGRRIATRSRCKSWSPDSDLVRCEAYVAPGCMAESRLRWT